jgi:cholesterol oxidase
MPRSLGVNPLLSISAVSERAMIQLARAARREIDMTPVAMQPDTPDAARTIGIRFTERMAGTMTDTAQGVPGPASFVVTICAADLDGFLGQRDHLAAAEGSVDLPALAPEPLTIVGGRFNLFTANEQRVETRQMEYRLPLRDAQGNLYFLHGRKVIHDDPGFDLWRDTSTLTATVHRGGDDGGEVLFTGMLTIAPLDFLRQLRTMTVTDAPDLASRLAAIRRFGFFFAGQLFESFGGSFARPSLYDEGHARAKRPLRVGAPELHHFTTADGKTLRLTRYRGGGKGPLILAHGLGVSSLIFSIDTIETNLLEYLYAAGYDCWSLDFRASINLGYVHDQFTADDVADHDYPAAVSYVREKTGAPSVQMMVHCYGAMSFAMAMLGGLQGVRAAAMSQIAAHADVPFFPQRLLAQVHAPDLMTALGVRVLDSRATTHRDALARLIDAGIGHLYPFQHQDRTRSVTSRRITAIFGPLYQLDQLNQATLDAMPEMFGKANVAAFRQLARIARAGHVVRADGASLVTDEHLRRFAVPTLFVHGALNRAFLPSGTKRTRDELSRVNGAHLYERVEIAGAGHIDSIFGTRAAEAVYPAIVRHLDRTARV